MTKQQTIEQIAKITTFESLYEEQNKLKIERDVVQNDIRTLVDKREKLTSRIGRLGRIASEKRRQIVDKKR